MAGRSRPAPPPEAPDPVAELAVLFPDVDLSVRDPDTGEAVGLTVREFRFREGLEAQAAARPLLAALAALIPVDPEAAMPDALAIEGALGAHADLWLELIARATGREAAWLGRLGDGDARALGDAMWAANGAFFIRRVVAAAAARERTERLFRSLASSIRSSAPATAAATPPSRTG